MNHLHTLLAQLSGAQPIGTLQAPIKRVHTDTRSLQAGDLFVALKGPHFDAHDFLPQARALGACGAIAHHGLAAAGLPGVQVPNTHVALTELARLWRAQLRPQLIAVTGSNGKTTVTQMLACILQAHAGAQALATEGNLNNDIGVPLTLLRLRPAHRLGAIELGMNHPGEIAQLAALVQPHIALVNNAQREHQEFMASVQAVARENGAVISALPANGTAVFPSDDPHHTPLWRELAGPQRRIITFSHSDPAACVYPLQAQWGHGAWSLHLHTPAGALSCTLRIAGQHNVRNALAAVACAVAAHVPLAAIAQGLQAFEPVAGRSRAIELPLHGRALSVVDDTYNANPDSVLAAIDVLTTLPGPRLLVLGDMGEVGQEALAFHTEVLRYANAVGIDQVYCTGVWMQRSCQALQATGERAAAHWPDMPGLSAAVCAAVSPPGPAGMASVLIKGSRFMRMERIVQALQALADPAAVAP